MAGCSSSVLSFEAEQFLDLQNDFAFYIIIPDALCASVIEVLSTKKKYNVLCDTLLQFTCIAQIS